MPRLTLCNEIGQIEIGIGAADKVGKVIAHQVVSHSLCHAAQHAEDELAALLLLGVKLFQTMVDAVFRILTNGTSIEEYSIGISLVITNFIAGHLHD